MNEMRKQFQEKFMRTFSAKIKQLRNQKGITQKELASIAKVSVSTIGNWEKCKGCPNLRHIYIICRHFKISISIFID